VSDRILLKAMRFEGHLGAGDEERAFPQEIEVDLEVETDLAPAGASDDLSATIDYGPLIELCRGVVEDRSFHLLEGIAVSIASAVLSSTGASAVTVRVRKLAVPVDADLDFAQVEIHRERD
jgi:dihydroneopterin aldolase